MVATAETVEAPAVPIEDRLRQVCGHLNVLHAQLVDLAAEALATDAWCGHGIRSLTHWLSWQCGISPTHAADIVRLAEAKATHPQVMETFADGALSVDQAAVATKAPAYLDGDFAELAQVCTVTQLRTAVRAARPTPPDTPSPSDNPSDRSDREEREWVVGWFDDDGHYRLHARLDPDHGREVDAALSEARDALFHTGHTAVSWVDALVEIAHRSLDGVPSKERRDRYRITWLINPADPIPAHWPDGIPIPHWLTTMLLCDGTISPVFTDGAHPVSVGRSLHQIPDRTRHLILLRDRKCRVPWCPNQRWLHIHHLHHQAHGGGHNTRDLIGICGPCHRLHHQGHLGITGNADHPNGLTFTDQHGQPIDPAAHPTKPTSPPPQPTRPYNHPIGERLHTRYLTFQPPPTHHPRN